MKHLRETTAKLISKRILVIAIAIMILVGCSRRIPRTDTFQAQGMKVGQITVHVADDALDDRREEVFATAEGSRLLREDLTGLLTAHGMFDESSTIALNIEVTSFRMRNGATRFFTGGWSGTDHLAGQITIAQAEKMLFQKPIRVSGGNGNPFNISSSSRSSGLVNSFAKLVVHALRNDPILPQSPQPSANQAAAPVMLVPAVTEQRASTPNSKAEATGSCSVDQVLMMKQGGLGDSQIRAACKGR